MNGGGFSFSTETPRDGQIDALNTLTHEAGHFLGLDHSSDHEATMYAQAPPGEIKKRSLETDDKNGICFLYEDFLIDVPSGSSYFDDACSTEQSGGADSVGGSADSAGEGAGSPSDQGPRVVHDSHGCSAQAQSRKSFLWIPLLGWLLLSALARRRTLGSLN